MKYLQINCEFSDFLMALAKTFRFCEEPDLEDYYQLAKDNLYACDETGKCGREITDEELMLIYNEIVEIQILETDRHFDRIYNECHYGRVYYVLGFTFPSQDNMQFAMHYCDDILPLFKILIDSCIAD